MQPHIVYTKFRCDILKKCNYCGDQIGYHDMYCNISCNARANEYYERKERFTKLFSVINVICVFGVPIGMFLVPIVHPVGAALVTVSLFLLGIMLTLFPFPTEDMIDRFKLKKAVFITRMIGVGLIACGIIALLLFLFI